MQAVGLTEELADESFYLSPPPLLWCIHWLDDKTHEQIATSTDLTQVRIGKLP